MTYICKICYRQVEENMMMHNMIGEVSSQCQACHSIIGKGAGYDGEGIDDSKGWFEGSEERRKQLELDKKL